MLRQITSMIVFLALAAVPHPAAAQTSRVKTVSLSTGVRMQYVEQGSVTGLPVVLLHGYTDSLHSFDPVAPYLPPSWHVFAITLRGHGDSSRPARGYTPRDFAADIAAFLDTRKIGRAVIVGHSMGGMIAQQFALDYPARTAALALVATMATLRGNESVREFWQSTIAPLRDPVDADMARGFQQSTLHQPIPPAFLDLAVRESLKVPARVWRDTLAALMETDFTGALGQIRAPALIIRGDRDTYFSRREQEALAAGIRGARLVVWPEAGHALHWEQPRRFADELIAFIQPLTQTKGKKSWK
ncbi:MAG: alpha/beta fold hydrolase [Blastocatellia bacterium]